MVGACKGDYSGLMEEILIYQHTTELMNLFREVPEYKAKPKTVRGKRAVHT